MRRLTFAEFTKEHLRYLTSTQMGRSILLLQHSRSPRLLRTIWGECDGRRACCYWSLSHSPASLLHLRANSFCVLLTPKLATLSMHHGWTPRLHLNPACVMPCPALPATSRALSGPSVRPRTCQSPCNQGARCWRGGQPIGASGCGQRRRRAACMSGVRRARARAWLQPSLA